jgi:D-alanyl-D-alanine carboxypeptidase
MTYREPARRTTRRTPTILVAGLLVVVAAIATSLGYPLLSSASSSPPVSSLQTSAPVSASPLAASRIPIPRSEPPGDLGDLGDLGEADGVVPDGTTVFDDEVPGVANLEPLLLRALRRAATGAAGDGVTFSVESGWRSRTYQEELFRQAVSEYGSAVKAARWVATPGTSAHESGDAVDIGHADATTWLSEHGAKYGLCQIYRNEPWHYELRPKATDHGCPRMYADPTHDPRMQP